MCVTGVVEGDGALDRQGDGVAREGTLAGTEEKDVRQDGLERLCIGIGGDEARGDERDGRQ